MLNCISLTLNLSGSIFTVVRDEIRIVLPLEFPESKGKYHK